MADGSAPISSRPRIAVVEDDESLALLLRYNIEAAGFRVEPMKDETVRLVISQMCEAGGVELESGKIAALRQIETGWR